MPTFLDIMEEKRTGKAPKPTELPTGQTFLDIMEKQRKEAETKPAPAPAKPGAPVPAASPTPPGAAAPTAPAEAEPAAEAEPGYYPPGPSPLPPPETPLSEKVLHHAYLSGTTAMEFVAATPPGAAVKWFMINSR